MIPILIAVLLLVGLIVTGFSVVLVAQNGESERETMQDKQALIFELYRYGVCFVMVLSFTILAYILLASLISDPSNVAAIGGPGAGVLLSGCVFFLHWRLKNPAHSNN